MSIRFRLLLLFSAPLLFLTSIGVYSTLVYRDCFAAADQIRESTRRTVDTAREAQSFFRAEIAAWKSLLLPSYEPDQYHHKLSSLDAADRQTRDALQVLLEVSEDLPDVHQSVRQLMGLHRSMGLSLRDSLQDFAETDNRAQASAERFLLETPDKASELFAQAVTLAQQSRDQGLRELNARRGATERVLLIVTASVLACSFGWFLWLLDRQIGPPAQRATYRAEVIDHAQRVVELGTWDWDSSRDSYYWSEGMYRIFGLAPNTRPSLEALMEAIHPEDRQRVVDTIEAAKRQPGAYELEYRVVPPGSAERVVEERGQVSASLMGPARLTGIIYDITQRKRAEEQLAVLANFDALTNLPNLYLFRDRLAHALEQAARAENRVALLLVDIDEFKGVHDAPGHTAGGELLKQVAGRLRQNLRDGDTLARLGADGFTVIIENVREADQLVHVAEHILAVLGEAFTISGQRLFVSANIGLSIFPDDAGDADTLLKNADSATHKAKGQGRSSYHFFTEDLS